MADTENPDNYAEEIVETGSEEVETVVRKTVRKSYIIQEVSIYENMLLLLWLLCFFPHNRKYIKLLHIRQMYKTHIGETDNLGGGRDDFKRRIIHDHGLLTVWQRSIEDNFFQRKRLNACEYTERFVDSRLLSLPRPKPQ